jgi:hypothetical protein
MTKFNSLLAQTRRIIGGCAFLVCLLLLVTGCGGTGGAAKQSNVAPSVSNAASSRPTTSRTSPTPSAEATLELQPAAASVQPAELDIEVLGNSTYRGILDEAVTLDGGVYEGDSFVAGSASHPVVTLLPEPVAFGDMNGDGRPDAAIILVSDSGGSGSFVYLAAVESRDGVADNVATLLLGDRVQVKSLAIEKGRLVARLLSHAPDDPACCPSRETIREFTLAGETLVEVE